MNTKLDLLYEDLVAAIYVNKLNLQLLLVYIITEKDAESDIGLHYSALQSITTSVMFPCLKSASRTTR
jgi:hypothetical protein